MSKLAGIEDGMIRAISHISGDRIIAPEGVDGIKEGMMYDDVIRLMMDEIKFLRRRVEHLEANKILLEEDYDKHEEVSDL